MSKTVFSFFFDPPPPPPPPPFKETNNDCSIMRMHRTHAPWLAFQARVGLDWLVQVGPWENLYVISLKYV